MCEALRELMKEEIAEEKAAGRAEGRAEERAEVQDVYNWLFKAGRAGDVEKATEDAAFYETLVKEYKAKDE